MKPIPRSFISSHQTGWCPGCDGVLWRVKADRCHLEWEDRDGIWWNGDPECRICFLLVSKAPRPLHRGTTYVHASIGEMIEANDWGPFSRLTLEERGEREAQGRAPTGIVLLPHQWALLAASMPWDRPAVAGYFPPLTEDERRARHHERAHRLRARHPPAVALHVMLGMAEDQDELLAMNPVVHLTRDVFMREMPDGSTEGVPGPWFRSRREELARLTEGFRRTPTQGVSEIGTPLPLPPYPSHSNVWPTTSRNSAAPSAKGGRASKRTRTGTAAASRTAKRPKR